MQFSSLLLNVCFLLLSLLLLLLLTTKNKQTKTKQQTNKKKKKKERGGGRGGNKTKTKGVFYALSAITVISGRYTFCRYTISVKNMSMLKTYTFFFFFLNSRKKWVEQKLKTFSQTYICMLCQVNPENQSLRERKTEIHV